MLSYAKSGTAWTGDRLNEFSNGKTQQFNSGGVVKWAYFQKKWSIPLREIWLISGPCEKEVHCSILFKRVVIMQIIYLSVN